MICKEVHKKMNAYLNRELDQKELVDFELHLNDLYFVSSFNKRSKTNDAISRNPKSFAS